MAEDLYYDIAKAGEGQYREKMSRFLAFAYPVHSADEAREIINKVRNEYHDARHVCWAYAVGPDASEWQLNDNGEPSGTAGKPILGQIRSHGVTDVVVAVVRYFGGIKLGTSGLIAAYREAASLALDDAGRKECYRTRDLMVIVDYMRLDAVLKIVRRDGVELLSSDYDNRCMLFLRVRESLINELIGRLEKVESVEISEK